METSGNILNIAKMLADTRTVLFATASVGTPVLRNAKQLALSLRPAKERTVAIVSLTDRGSQEATPQSDPADLVLAKEWRYAPSGGTEPALISWVGSNPDDPPNNSISTSAVAALLKKLSRRFDLILVEAGSDPVPSSQQFALAPLCSGTLLLVRKGISTAAEVQRCETRLNQCKARILGCIFVEGTELSSPRPFPPDHCLHLIERSFHARLGQTQILLISQDRHRNPSRNQQLPQSPVRSHPTSP